MPSPFPNLPPQARGQVHQLRHRSDVLRDNPWNDPVDRDLYVYTPRGYASSERALPAILFLAAYSGTGEKLLARGFNTMSIASRIDRLVHDGCPPFIAVLPDCMTTLGGSQYVDSPGLGNYASYVVDEIRGCVDDAFRTTGRWGVIGHSSGGFGALHLAGTRPGAFQAAACHAGDMGFDLCYLGDLSAAIAGVRKLGGLDGFVEAFWDSNRPPGAAFAGLSLLCMACAYSPDPAGRPVPARLPVDFDTGEVDFEVFHSWRAFDPVVAVDEPSYADGLRQLDLLYLDCGSDDEYHLQYGARRFVGRLEALGIGHRYDEFKGGHRGTSHRFDTSLPLLAAALDAG